jgi:D-alanyl-lipoteichoic acid acyltransferase DltB (MBOAT superfamily)
MLFNSLEFLLFFPVVTILYFLLPHRWRWLHLLIASCIFYMAFIPVYVLILVFTIVIDYCAGIMIAKSAGKRRRFFLIISIIANVGILAVFKYYNFFIENVNELLDIKEQGSQLPYLNLVLPIGLSFHTFQAMSYTIEVYRGNQTVEKHFGIYALYVMFYPQLVAGPIERPQNLLHQFREKHSFDSNRIYEGLRLMLWGLFKKVVIADRLSIYVDIVYGNSEQHSGINLFVATILFAIQIYCDFSGYSDIAIGSAKVMGFKLMTNFNRPYFAKNIQEFWKRWHISLSTWFRDYVYISLGGNRISKARTYLNVAIVFVLSGLWHGANWTFIIWGTFHAGLIIGYMLFREHVKIRITKSYILSDLLAILLTFSVVCLGWVFFRAYSFNNAAHIFYKIFHARLDEFEWVVKNSRGQFGMTSTVISLVMIGVLFLNDRFQNIQQSRLHHKPFSDILFNGLILFFVIAFGVFQKTSFIYFQF